MAAPDTSDTPEIVTPEIPVSEFPSAETILPPAAFVPEEDPTDPALLKGQGLTPQVEMIQLGNLGVEITNYVLPDGTPIPQPVVEPAEQPAAESVVEPVEEPALEVTFPPIAVPDVPADIPPTPE